MKSQWSTMTRPHPGLLWLWSSDLLTQGRSKQMLISHAPVPFLFFFSFFFLFLYWSASGRMIGQAVCTKTVIKGNFSVWEKKLPYIDFLLHYNTKILQFRKVDCEDQLHSTAVQKIPIQYLHWWHLTMVAYHLYTLT